MTITQKAGAIVLSKNNPALVALLFRSKQNDWSFPKGHIENNETPVEAAKREVLEETGLTINLIDELPTFHYEQNSGNSVDVSMFLSQSNNDPDLKNEFDGDKILWVDYSEVPQKLTYENAKQYYLQIIITIEQKIKNR
ncbi:MAG: NUDIX domain-containing protein [Candidatus Magasanikbacteria bacterium]|jgi:8-oxo-dGTP pyrophosphatase MutT (NUDIX family)